MVKMTQYLSWMWRSRLRRALCLLVFAALGVTLRSIFFQPRLGESVKYRVKLNRPPIVTGEFPGDESGALIPHIIHQTWDTHAIPREFAPWIQSWSKHHPQWEYWLWTPDDVQLLLSTYYPEYLKLYQTYKSMQQKANIMRYFIMYHFGGVYADLDLESLKPMDPWTYKHYCILPQETYVHSLLLSFRKRANAMLTLLACRPRHPYYKLAIEGLTSYSQLTHKEKLLYVDDVYIAYNTSLKGKIVKEKDQMYMAEPKYFLPTFDPNWDAIIKSMCTSSHLNSRQKEICYDLKMSKYYSYPDADSYTDHHWVHVATKDSSFKKRDNIHIYNLVPEYKNILRVIKEDNSWNRAAEGGLR